MANIIIHIINKNNNKKKKKEDRRKNKHTLFFLSILSLVDYLLIILINIYYKKITWNIINIFYTTTTVQNQIKWSLVIIYKYNNKIIFNRGSMLSSEKKKKNIF